MAAASPTDSCAHVEREVYDADEVSTKLDIARPTVYAIARREPETLGAVRVGRAVRFRRTGRDHSGATHGP